MRRKFFKSFALTLLTLICTMACSGCYFAGMVLGVGAALLDEKINDANKAFALVGEPTITCTYNKETQKYDVVIDGVVKNNSDKRWQICYVDLLLYDTDNTLLGESFVYAGYDIEPSGTWRFYATAQTNYEAVSVKVYDFTGRLA